MGTVDEYYVYLLVDPRSGKPFYVGKGKGRRMKQHAIEARSGKGGNAIKCRTILDIESDGLDVKYVVYESGLSERDAFDQESALIRQYGLVHLTNIAPGAATPEERSERARAVLVSLCVNFDDCLAKLADLIAYYGVAMAFVSDVPAKVPELFAMWVRLFKTFTAHREHVGADLAEMDKHRDEGGA